MSCGSVGRTGQSIDAGLVNVTSKESSMYLMYMKVLVVSYVVTETIVQD